MVPFYIPDAETQIVINDWFRNNITLTFDSWTTYRRIVKTASDYQVDKGSSSDISSPKYLIAGTQTEVQTAVPN